MEIKLIKFKKYKVFALLIYIKENKLKKNW